MYCYISLKYVVVKVHFMTKYIVQLTVTLVIDSVISVADNFTDKLFYDCVLLCRNAHSKPIHVVAPLLAAGTIIP